MTYLKVFFRGEGGAKLNDQIFRVRRHSFDYVFKFETNFGLKFYFSLDELVKGHFSFYRKGNMCSLVNFSPHDI